MPQIPYGTPLQVSEAELEILRGLLNLPSDVRYAQRTVLSLEDVDNFSLRQQLNGSAVFVFSHQDENSVSIIVIPEYTQPARYGTTPPNNHAAGSRWLPRQSCDSECGSDCDDCRGHGPAVTRCRTNNPRIFAALQGIGLRGTGILPGLEMEHLMEMEALMTRFRISPPVRRYRDGF